MDFKSNVDLLTAITSEWRSKSYRIHHVDSCQGLRKSMSLIHIHTYIFENVYEVYDREFQSILNG